MTLGLALVVEINAQKFAYIDTDYVLLHCRIFDAQDN